MQLIDSHCHLTFPELAGRIDAVLERARDVGVQRMITIGTTPDDVARAIQIAEQNQAVFVGAGIHPHEAGKFTENDLTELCDCYAHPRVVAAGEMGLDYHYDFADRQTQQRVFEAQLAACRNADLPVVIHNRDAAEDTVRILRDAGFSGRRVVFHCFTGNASQARLIRDHGWRLSFTGIVTFKNAREIREIARTYPTDELMLETDSPYLSPDPVRQIRPNEPSHLIHTARFLADLRGRPLEELAELTTRNTTEFFSLDPSEPVP